VHRPYASRDFLKPRDRTYHEDREEFYVVASETKNRPQGEAIYNVREEPWYAAAAQRLSAARPNLTKDSPSLSPADDKQARENA
jgi:hypothetical protein